MLFNFLNSFSRVLRRGHIIVSQDQVTFQREPKMRMNLFIMTRENYALQVSKFYLMFTSGELCCSNDTISLQYQLLVLAIQLSCYRFQL